VTRRALWRSVALLTGVLLALVSAVGMLRGLAQESYTGHRSYAMPVSQLTVDSSAGNITVVPGPVGRVTVIQRLHWATTRPSVTVVPHGDTMTLGIDCGEYGPVSDWGCSADVTVEVPPQTSVVSDDDAGTIDVQRLSGALDLQSGGGVIRLQGVSGQVQATAGSGEVLGEGLLSATVVAGTDSGDIQLTFSRPPQRVQAEDGSGSVGLHLPPGSRYRVSGGCSPDGSWDVTTGLQDASAVGSIGATCGSGSVDIVYAAR
jgi:hypothetical protein